MSLQFDPDKPEYKYITDEKEANKALDKLSKERIIAVDSEATSLDPYLAKLIMVQIATPSFCYIFDARKLNLRENKKLKDLLENKKLLKLFQNAKFDYGILKITLGIGINNVYDTMLAEGVLTAGLNIKKNLKVLAKRYTDVELEKDVRETFYRLPNKLNEEQLKYGALDTLILFPIFEAQLPLLEKEGLNKIAKLEFAVTTVIAEMELKGLFIDTKKWRDIIVHLTEKRNRHAQEFQDIIRPYYSTTQVDLFGNMADSININSQVQLMDLFNKKLGLSVPSTGDAILAGVDHPAAKKLREYRKYEKLISAFGEGLLEKINKVTKRLHPDFIQLGAATGRFACANPNLQQIPRNSEEAPFRSCFNPEPGYKLVVADYSNFEMRILADLSGDKKMIQALKDGRDIHSYTASLMFNKEYSSDFRDKHPELRQIAKPIGFGLVYGMGPVGLSAIIDTTPEKSRDYMDRYFSSYPSVRRFLNRMSREALRKGWSKTPGGRKRWYRRPDKSAPDYRRKVANIERQAKNHPIQGTNADAIKYALVFLHERLKKEGVDGAITHTVHDEIVCEVREDQAEDWSVIQAKEMVKAGELFLENVPVISEPYVGDVWEH